MRMGKHVENRILSCVSVGVGTCAAPFSTVSITVNREQYKSGFAPACAGRSASPLSFEKEVMQRKD
jgi:hypothetical protein